MSEENSGSRQVVQPYLEQLLERADYGRYFSADVTFSVGDAVVASGAQGVEQFIRFLHEQAFDAHPEVVTTVFGDNRAAAEVVFVGKHIGEFQGVAPTGNSVRVPYSVFYDVADERISALRAYIPMDQLIAQTRGDSQA